MELGRYTSNSTNDLIEKTEKLLEERRKTHGKKYVVKFSCIGKERIGTRVDQAITIPGKFLSPKEAREKAESMQEELNDICKKGGFKRATIEGVLTEEYIRIGRARS